MSKMWAPAPYSSRRFIRFFLTSMVTETLESYYKTNTSLRFNHGFTITEIEDMFPFELDVYVSLRLQELEERKQKQQL